MFESRPCGVFFSKSSQLLLVNHRSMWLRRLVLDTSLLRPIMLPLECLLNRSQPENGNATSALSSGKEFLLKEMVSSKCHCVTLLSHSLCALEKMLVEASVVIQINKTLLLNQIDFGMRFFEIFG